MNSIYSSSKSSWLSGGFISFTSLTFSISFSEILTNFLYSESTDYASTVIKFLSSAAIS